MCVSEIHEIFTLHRTLIKQYGCFKLVHCLKKSGRQSLVIPEILVFVSHCLANFQPILDCFIPNVKLKYEDSKNIKADRVNTVVFNLHQIKRWTFFLGHPAHILTCTDDMLDLYCTSSLVQKVPDS